MASGVPVVASQAGGLAEVVEHGLSGFLEPIGDVEAMANRALELLNDSKKHAVFMAQAIASSKRFSMEAIGQTYLDLYNSLVHGE